MRERLKGGGSRLRDEGLGCRDLSGSGSSLLAFGDVRTAILAIIDTLAGPGGFSRESSDDLACVKNASSINEGRTRTLVAVEMLKKWTKPMFLSRTILT